MLRTWINPQNTFISLVFLCSIFLMLFYDGYIKITSHAGVAFAANPHIELSIHTEKARSSFLDGLILNVESEDFRKEINNTYYRQKLRWAYKAITNGALETLRAATPESRIKYIIFAFFLFQAATLTIGFIFMCLSFRVLSGRQDEVTTALIAFSFFWFYTLSAETPFIREAYFAFTELTCISAGIYFALRQKLLAFLVVLAVAVMNRETGAGMGIIYLILNWGRPKAWGPFIVGPVILLAFNVGFFTDPATYNISNFLTPAVGDKAEFLTIFNLGALPFPYVVLNLFKTILFILPAIYIAGRAWKSDMGRRFVALAGVYSTVFLLGAQIGDLMAASFLVPFIISMYGAHIGYAGRSD